MTDNERERRVSLSTSYRLIISIVVLALTLFLPSVAMAGEDQWINNGPPNSNVKTVNISPNYLKDYTVFAGTTGNGVYKSTDGGKTWIQVNNGLTNLDVRSIAVSLAYATDKTVFAGTAGGVFKSVDGGANWSKISSGMTNLDVRSVGLSPNYVSDKTVFTGTGGGIFKSTNGGSSWSLASAGLNTTDIRVIALSPNFAIDKTVFAGSYGGGVFKTTNAGDSWSAASSGFSSSLVTDIVCSPNFAIDKTVFVGTYGGGVFKTTNAGASWAQVNNGIPQSDIYVLAVAVSPDYAKDEVVFAGTNGGVYRSKDGAASWKQANNGLMHKLIPSIDPTPCYCLDKTVFAGSDGGGVYSCIFSSAPVTTISVNPVAPDGENGWFRTKPTITLTSDKPGTIYYQWDSTSTAGWTTYSTSISGKDGQHTLYYFAQDVAGNKETVKSQAFKVDSILPANPTVGSPSHTVGGWSNDTTVDVSFSGAGDAISGVAGYSIQWSTSANTLPDKTVDLAASVVSATSPALADGPWYFHISTKDNAGNWSDAVHLGPFNIDTVVSITTIETSPSVANGTDGWFTVAPVITLTNSEEGPTYYQWDSTSTAGWITYPGSFTAPEGEHTLYAYSKDLAGNVGVMRTRSLKVDAGVPTAFNLSSPSNNASLTNVSPPTFTWGESTDTRLAKYELYIDGALAKGDIPTSTRSYTLEAPLAPGSHTWYVNAVDLAGNKTKSTATFNLTITDGVAPTTAASSDPSYTDGGFGWFKSKPNIYLTSDEPGTTYYQWDSTSGAWTTYTGAFPALEGIHTLYYYSKDSAGNNEAAKSQVFKVDTTPPASFNLSSPANGASTTNAALPTFTWSASSDSGSGFSRYQLYIDGAISRDGIIDESYTLTKSLTAGTHTWSVKAVDIAGNITSASATFTINVTDVVAPVTTGSSSPAAPSNPDGWFSPAPSIALASDEAGTTYYQWDSTSTAGWQSYTTSLIAPEGEHTLYYYSKDSTGNSEQVQSQTYKVDTTPPAGFNLSSPANGATVNNDAPQSFFWNSTSDSQSGLAKYQLYINGTLRQDNISASSTSTTLSGSLVAGSHTWYVKAVDSVGNAVSSPTFTVDVRDVIPPTTNLSSNPSYTSGWFKTVPTITLSRNEQGTTYYQWDSTTGDWTTYTGSFSGKTGEHTLYYSSEDSSGNKEATKSTVFKVDTEPPAAFELASPANNAESNNATIQTLTWNASSDAPSGLAKYQLYIDGSLHRDNIAPSTTSFTMSSPMTAGTHTWYVKAVDAAGNTTNSTSTYTLNIADVVAPTTTLATSPTWNNGTNGWFKTTPTITLTRNEAGTTYYQWDSTGGAWQTYSGSITALEGSHTLYYYSVDSAGNTESNKTKALKVDTSAPAAFDISLPANGATVNNDKGQTFTWIASSDAISGIGKYQLWVNGVLYRDGISASATSYTLSSSLAVGNHTWYIKAVDVAGNATSSQSVFDITVKDVVPPATSLTTSPTNANGTNGWFVSSPTITLSRNEAGTTYYQWDSTGGNWTEYTGSFPALEGQHTLYYYSVDTAGNNETSKSKLFKVDTTAPGEFDLVSPTNGETVNNDKGQTFTWTASSDAALAKYQVFVDNKLYRDGISASATSYSSQTSLAPGSHTWFVKAVDSAGNTLNSTSVYNLTVNDVVAPVTTLVTSPPSADGSSGWFKTGSTITLSSNEPATIYYQWDSTGGNWSEYSGPLTAPEGQHTLYYYSKDSANNSETAKSKLIKVDLDAPQAFDLVSPADGATVNNDKGQSFAWGLSTDTASGMAKYQLWVNGALYRDGISASATSYTLTASLEATTHSWYIQAVDVAGNTTRSTSTRTLTVNDVVAPTTSLFTNPASPNGNNSWFISQPSVTLSRNEPGTTYYQWDSTSTAGWITYSALTGGTVLPDGQHTLYYYSVDSKGNTESVKSKALKLDRGAPTSSISPITTQPINTTSYTVTGTASDVADSGVARVEVSIDGGSWQTASGTSSWSYFWANIADGSHTIKSRAVDVAGNIGSASAEVTVLVDHTRPTIVSVSPAADASNVDIVANVSATFSENMDEASVINAFTLKDANNNLIPATVTYNAASKTVTLDPQNNLVFSTVYTATISTAAKDLAGSSLATAKTWSFTTKPETAAPYTTLSTNPVSPDGTNGWFKTVPTITLKTDKSGTTTYYQWDGTTDGQWTVAPIGGFNALEGEHTLYYYSRDSSGTTEATKSSVFKVDTTAPAAPANVKAMGASTSSILVIWDAPAETIAKYEVFNASNNQLLGSTTANSFTWGGLSADTTYTCYVKAYDIAGNLSVASANASGKTFADTTQNTTTDKSGSDINLGSGVTVNFENINSNGETTAQYKTGDQLSDLAKKEINFRFRGYWLDVHTTAGIGGVIKVTVSYDESMVPGNEKNLKLMHYNGKKWEDITTEVNTEANTITGITTSLSPLAFNADGATSSAAQVAFGANTNLLLALSLALLMVGSALVLRKQDI